MLKTMLAAAAALLITVAVTPAAQAQDAPAAGEADILQNLINNPNVNSWQVLGVQRPVRPQRAQGVLGERALRVSARRSDQPWSTATQMPVTGAIRQGDTILLAVWARAETLPEGEETTRLPLRVQEAAAPYGGLAQDAGEVGTEWKMIYASGVAQRDYPAGTVNLSVHLATADHTIDIGPALLFNFGQNYDASRLPRND
jgi:hypothetical protein